MNVAQPRVGFVTSLPARPADPSPHRLATGIVLVYLFLLTSRGIETIPGVLGINLHLAVLLTTISVLAAVLTGGLFGAMKTPVAVMFTLLTCWLLLATLTSEWRGGSVQSLINFWFVSYACSLVVPSLISNIDQCRKVFTLSAFSLIPILIATVLFETHVGGRDGTMFGTLGNPNDLAFSLLLLIPFAVFVIQSESWLNWKSLVCVVAVALSFIKILRTGSRSGLIAMAFCVVALLLGGTAKAKVKILVATALLVLVAFAFVPGELLRRYATLFNGTTYEADMTVDEISAVESSRARKTLFEGSVRMMFEHPVFGVGPGIFAAALAGEQKDRGELQTWHEAHNSFTQLGSEAGLPALAIYLAIVGYCLKRTLSIYRSTRRDPNQIQVCRMAGTLLMALIIFIVCAAFGNYSLTFHFPVLAGLVQAFDVSVRREATPVPAVVFSVPPMRSAIPALEPQVPNYVRHRRLRDRRV